MDKTTEVKSTSPVKKKEPTEMDFPTAIRRIMDGEKVTRIEWNNENEFGILKDGWLMIHTRGKFHTWQVSEGDMVAMDWVVIVQSN